MLKLAKDRRMSSRMMGALSKVKNLDLTSPRGERKVQLGLVSPEGKALLSGFNFNKEARFDSVFRALYTLDTTTGTFEVPDFQVSEMLKVPEGTTHVSLSDAVSRVDFEASTFVTSMSPKTNLAVGAIPADLSLVPASVPTGNGFLFFYLLLEFFQEINGTQYPLKDHTHNVLCLLAVAE